MLNRNISTRKTVLQCFNKRLHSTFEAVQPGLLRKYPIGLTIHGYEIQDLKAIPEFSMVAVKLEHLKTGSQHLHLEPSNDDNNVFLIAFKTNPPDATGVPHILEHTTLCGSYKYPIRDPFFKMLNRSLSNFMNAMTGHDYTYYPFATTNAKDFENLMDVYLSSVFEPLLTHEDFLQEGWRLENSDISDKNSDIEYKGVVFNEMKGQYSNTAYYYWIKFQEAVYPSLKNSGGDPLKIPTLNYEDLIDFHSENYHPSNAKTFTYGALPLDSHLKKLNSVISTFGKRLNKPIVRKPVFVKDKFESNITINGPVDSMSGIPIEDQYKSSITWDLGDPLDESKQYEVFKWKILSSLLCDGHNAPFYQELIEKGYGDDYSVNTGLDSTSALLSFTVGLNNLNKENTDKLEDLIVNILRNRIIPELSEGGNFDERIQAILHQIEINFRKHKPDFGIGLLNSIVPTWTNGLDPLVNLQLEETLNKFKLEYSELGLKLFIDLINDTLLNPSTKTFKFTMTPDLSFNEKLISEENDKLKSTVEELTEEDKEVIFKRGKNLFEKQQKEEDASILPTLTIKDIPRKGNDYPLSFTNIGDQSLQKRVVDTNGLVYVSALKDISFLPTKYYKYLPLFTSCLTNLAGTEKMSVTDLETKIQGTTGGLSFNVSAKTDPNNIMKPRVGFSLSGMSLKDNSENIYSLWNEILNETNFDFNDEQVVDKFAILVKNLGQNQSNIIADRGHSYANMHGNAKLTPTKYINDIFSGITQIEFIADLNAKLEKDGKESLALSVLPILKEIKLQLTTRGNYKYNIVSDKDSIIENEQLIGLFDSALKKGSVDSNELDNLLKSFDSGDIGDRGLKNSLINLPFQVGYASLSKLGTNYCSKDGAALQVLAQLLTFKHLHSVIRESNGAYGGGLNYDGLGGTLNFYSYRDPNPMKSVKSFKESFEVALTNSTKWDTKDLQEAKLAIFQSIDAPRNISTQGSSYFFEGITDEMKQERREHFLDVNNEDLKSVAEKYLNNSNDFVTIIGNNELIRISEGKDWKVKDLNA